MKNLSNTKRIILVLLAISLSMSGCKSKGRIGDIAESSDPIMAVVFENREENGEYFSGVVYRKVTDAYRLITSSKHPVLIAYLDDSPYSSNAISFIETLADENKDDLLVIRVDVQISRNSEEVQELVDIFRVNTFPFFALIESGVKIGYVKGYTGETEEKINSLIEKTK